MVRVLSHMPTGDAILVCYRTKDMPVPHTQSMVGKCPKCGQAIWVAMSSPPLIKKICTQCVAATTMREGRFGKPVEFSVTEAQMADAERIRQQKRGRTDGQR